MLSRYSGYACLSSDSDYSLLNASGRVPVIKLNRFHRVFLNHSVLLKLESCNPSGSIKDKNAATLIALAEKNGRLKPGGTVVESSSGNFGIALASVGASRGYKVIIVIDAKTPPPMRRMLEALGAELREVPLSLADASGSMQKARMGFAKKLAGEIDAFYPCQHLNPDNPLAHYYHTGPELLRDLPEAPDYVFVGISTAGQITGITRYLQEAGARTKVIAVDVSGSVALGGKPSAYKMTGLGLSFSPPNFDPSTVWAGYQVPDEISFNTCIQLAKREGLLLGASTGALLAGAVAFLRQCNPNKSVAVINPDRGDRYLDTVYNPDWMKAQGFRLFNREALDRAFDQLKPVVISEGRNKDEKAVQVFSSHFPV